MASGDDALAVLRDISTKLDTLIAMAARAGHGPSTPAARPPFARAGNGPSAVPRGPRPDPPREASDKDLDSDHGDPEVRAKSPRDWTGPSMQGRRFSECPAEYLDLVASRLDYFANQNEAAGDAESVKKARYNRLDASRARGWAVRIRDGHVPTRHVPEPFGDDNDIPFSWVIGFIVPALGALHSAVSVLS
jgi:hypothetical protein